MQIPSICLRKSQRARRCLPIIVRSKKIDREKRSTRGKHARRQTQGISLINPSRLSTSCRRTGRDPLVRATATQLPNRTFRPCAFLVPLRWSTAGGLFFKRLFSSPFSFCYILLFSALLLLLSVRRSFLLREISLRREDVHLYIWHIFLPTSKELHIMSRIRIIKHRYVRRKWMDRDKRKRVSICRQRWKVITTDWLLLNLCPRGENVCSIINSVPCAALESPVAFSNFSR